MGHEIAISLVWIFSSWIMSLRKYDWKIANIIPIFKRGRSDLGSCGSVILTSTVCKILVQILNERIAKDIERNINSCYVLSSFMRG